MVPVGFESGLLDSRSLAGTYTVLVASSCVLCGAVTTAQEQDQVDEVETRSPYQ